MNEPLFRKEVLAQRQTTAMGTVLLLPRLSHRIYVIFGASTALALIGLLFFADYARKARINGWLVPQQGLVQVYAPQGGVVTEFFVEEGAAVQKGDRLVSLSGEMESTELGATHRQIVRQLKSRRDSLKTQRKELESLLKQQRSSLRRRLAALKDEKQELVQELALRGDRLRLAAKSEERLQTLMASGAVAAQQLQSATEAKLEENAKVHELERERAANAREQLAVQGEIDDLPLRSQAEMARVEREIAQVDQELAEAELRRGVVISAPVNGTVTAIQAEVGGRPRTELPLLSIIPAGSKLEAQLYCPSRAVGFLQPGQRVLLRYQPFPYQKFGHYEGVLSNISRTAVNPGELPPQLAGLTSLVGSGEPMYRIDVALEKQEVRAYGKPMALQPGMKLDADVVIEKRRLVEWMLDPLYTVTGRMAE